MAVIDRKFDRKILSCDPGPGHVFFFSIHRARCRDLGKMTAVVIARSNNRDRHSPGSFPKNWETIFWPIRIIRKNLFPKPTKIVWPRGPKNSLFLDIFTSGRKIGKTGLFSWTPCNMTFFFLIICIIVWRSYC